MMSVRTCVRVRCTHKGHHRLYLYMRHMWVAQSLETPSPGPGGGGLGRMYVRQVCLQRGSFLGERGAGPPYPRLSHANQERSF